MTSRARVARVAVDDMTFVIRSMARSGSAKGSTGLEVLSYSRIEIDSIPAIREIALNGVDGLISIRSRRAFEET